MKKKFIVTLAFLLVLVLCSVGCGQPILLEVGSMIQEKRTEAEAEPEVTFVPKQIENSLSETELLLDIGGEKFSCEEGYFNENTLYDTTLCNDVVVGERYYQNGKKISELLGKKIVFYTYPDNAYQILWDNEELLYTTSNGKLSSREDILGVTRYEYSGDKLTKTLNTSTATALDIAVDSDGRATMLKQYRFANNKYYLMKNISFETMPENWNSNIVYERNETFDGKQYITKKTTSTAVHTYTYQNGVITSETIAPLDESLDSKEIHYLFDSQMSRIGFMLDGQTFFYLYDYCGNVEKILNENQTVVAEYHYNPMGVPTVSGTQAELMSQVNGFSFHGRENWYYDQQLKQFYIGADVIFNNFYNVNVLGDYPVYFIQDPMNHTLTGEVRHIDEKSNLSLSSEIKNKVQEIAGDSLIHEGFGVIKNAMASDAEKDMRGRIDLYTVYQDDDSKRAFGNQAYFITDAEGLSESATKSEVLLESSSVFDGTKTCYPLAGQLLLHGHFIYQNRYIKYDSFEETNVIVYEELENISSNYDESYGNCYNFDSQNFTMYFGSGESYDATEVVTDMVYEIDWQAIHQQIEASLPVYENKSYSVDIPQVFYISQEYLDAVERNQQENIYFGNFTAQELLEQYGDDWNFVYRDGEYVHHSEVAAEGFNWGNFVSKVAIGIGVILVSAVITVATAGAGSVSIGCVLILAAKMTAVAVVGGVVNALVHSAIDGNLNSFTDNFADGFMFSAIAVSAVTVAGGGFTPACFVAGTPVATASGLKPIEEIKAGNLVLSRNLQTGKNEYKRVGRTFERQTDSLVSLEANQEKIVTTPEHPFYVKSIGWQKAGMLRIGNQLIQKDGEGLSVDSVHHQNLSSPVTVYNFEVEENHNYFVGERGILVHNSCGEQVLGQTITQSGMTDAVIGSAVAAGIMLGGVVREVISNVNTGTVTLPNSFEIAQDRATDQDREQAKTKIEELKLSRPGDKLWFRWGDRDDYSTFYPRIGLDDDGLSLKPSVNVFKWDYAFSSYIWQSEIDALSLTSLEFKFVSGKEHYSIVPKNLVEFAGWKRTKEWISHNYVTREFAHPYAISVHDFMHPLLGED